MPNIFIKMNTYKVNYACDECSQKPNPGCLLEFTGLIKTCNPPFYEHQCKYCKKLFNLPNRYPDIWHIADDEM